MNDLQIKQAVTDELEFDPSIDGAHVAAFVHDGVVTLAGYVGDYTEKHAVEIAARRISGIRAVAQQIEVRLASDRKIADDEIADRAARILDWDLRLPRHAIQVTVENGVVVLSGAVAWDFQRREAEADVRKLGGVRAVSNQLCVRASPALGKARHPDRPSAAGSVADRQDVGPFDDRGIVKLCAQPHSSAERTLEQRPSWAITGATKAIDPTEAGEKGVA